MLFNSFEYLLLLAAVVFLYYRINQSWRRRLIFFASFLFYAAWSPVYYFLMLATVYVNYLIACFLAGTVNSTSRKTLLSIAVVISLGVIAYFKYTNFALSTFCSLFHLLGVKLDYVTQNILLPLGVSFYTFQVMSYTIDVYRGEIKASRSFFDVAEYITFFPQLVAGPIERARDLMMQLVVRQPFLWINIRNGINLILWGIMKKVVFADNLARYADMIFGNPSNYSSWGVLLGVYAFAFQIYFDFSAYSQIAKGSAQLLGIHLTTNFKLPYLSASMSEFWHRWHITLSTWLRDYLYIPLGGSRAGEAKTYRNLMITMLLGGLWHGANLTFLLWGGFHGSLLCIERFFRSVVKYDPKPTIKKILIPFGVFFTFHLAAIGWIFFRADSVVEGFQILKKIVRMDGTYLSQDLAGLSALIAGLFIGHLLWYPLQSRFRKLRANANVALDLAYSFVVIMILIVGGPIVGGKFIYFEF